jgi:N-acetylglucosamine-1-phosphate uridyltransferase (contains nucleotidyltransferase and I-patch acetyltransferase domains)
MIDTTFGEDEMKSFAPKALMKICGQSMYGYPACAALKAGISEYMIIGEKENFKEETCYESIEKAVSSTNANLYLYVRADMPFIESESIKGMLEYQKASQSDVVALYQLDEDGDELFSHMALITREKIVSEKDVNSVIQRAEKEETLIKAYSQSDEETFCVCDRCDLSVAESIMRGRINEELMLSGVTMIDPMTAYIAADVKIGMDTVIFPNVMLESGTVIGERVSVGANTTIHNSTIGDDCQILSSVIIDSEIKHGTRLGPFAYIRPNSHIGPNAKIGDFVEVKNSTIGEKTSVSHLTYIGDSDVGSHINFGCGCVTVNYDGKNKYRCNIGDNSFIGCNTNLVAPVTVGKGAYIAAGSTITDEVPKDTLAIARARQVNKTGWKDKRK